MADETKRIHELSLYNLVPPDDWTVAIDHPSLTETVRLPWSIIATNTIEKSVTQNGHGFTIGTPIYFDGSVYQRADSTTTKRANIVGLVSAVVSANIFKFITSGFISGLTARIPGEIYYLTSTPGTLSTTAPATGILRAAYIAISSTEVYIINHFPQILNIEPSQFNIVTGSLNLAALQIQTFTMDIPTNRYFNLSVEVTGLASGETCKVQFSGTTAHTNPYYIANFSSTLPIDSGSAFIYRDESSNKKLNVKIENTSTSSIICQIRVKGEPV